MLYWAYGSNLNIAQMKRRCPRAKPLCKLHLCHTALVFRGVADVVYDPEQMCPGGIWEITPACERELDLYEGVAHGLYRKEYLTVSLKKGPPQPCLYYQMNEEGVMPPSEAYVETIERGYHDFGLDLAYLDRAIQASWDDKDKTPRLIHRHRAKGSPQLCR